MSPTIESIEPALEDSSGLDSADRLPTVSELRSRHRLSAIGRETVMEARREFGEILAGRDRRMVLVIGPCSIHDTGAALEYARRVRRLREIYGKNFLILMWAYLEKPRTTVGWKGLVSDPALDGSCNMNHGLELGRKLLCDLAEMGVPAATELVDPTVTPYIEDVIAWASVGARTVESQVHRQLVSGLAAPAGFKNGTQGNTRVAIDAILAARHPHVFPAIGPDGAIRVTRTKGNEATHLVLRGGRVGSSFIPNGTPEGISEVDVQLKAAALPARVMVDCSHANSAYDPCRQIEVANELIAAEAAQRSGLFGLMLESNLQAGQQKLSACTASLRPGVSITDACIGMEETEEWVRQAAEMLDG